MKGDVPGKVLLGLGGIIAATLVYLGLFSGTYAYIFWGLSLILVVLGLINWGVK